MMVLRTVASKYLYDVLYIQNRSAVSFKRAPRPPKTFPMKSKPVPCPYVTPSMEKALAENASKTPSLLSQLSVMKKSCPKFCAYMEKQCPPLVPPITRPMPKIVKGTSKSGRQQADVIQNVQEDVPYAAVMAYRLFKFGAKIGVAAYCVKWTRDIGLWGSGEQTSELWNRWSANIRSILPQFNTMGSCNETGSLAHCWNTGVIIVFDSFIDASRWLKRKVIDKEREVYGLPVFSGNAEADSAANTLATKYDTLKERLLHSDKQEYIMKQKKQSKITPDSDEYFGTRPSGGAPVRATETKSSEQNLDFTVVITEPSLHEAPDELEQPKIMQNEYHEIAKTEIDNELVVIQPSLAEDGKVEGEDDKDPPQVKEEPSESSTPGDDVGSTGATEGEVPTDAPEVQQHDCPTYPPCMRPDCPKYIQRTQASVTENTEEIQTDVEEQLQVN